MIEPAADAGAWRNRAPRAAHAETRNRKVEWTMTDAFTRQTGPFLSRLLALSLVWISLATPAEVSVQIERQEDAFNVEANLLVVVDQRVAWEVLTDYNNLASFVPGMRSSRIVSAPGQPLLLEQKGESGFLLFRVPIEVVSRIEEVPLGAVRFQSVSGNLRNKRGEWALAQHDHATRVSYRASITPAFLLPPLIGPAIVGRDVRIMVESVAREMLRRAESTDRATTGAALPAGQ